MTKHTDTIGLGIDAGGTFTDGAVVDLHTGVVLSKFKTPTTKEDLPGSIRRCLDGLDAHLLSQCILASLSTTFATNAIVEGKGARAGVLLLGYDKYDIAKVQAEHKIAVKGKHDIRGREVDPINESEIRRAVNELVQAENVQALAISGMCSVLNPAHELAARGIASDEADLPVVCGHELSMELDAIRRATTAYLNARLLPVVVDLIHAVESELRKRHVGAPLMVVRSDGSLMSVSDALVHPIHTIFSGPAASGVGALYLAGVQDAIVVDIGGTTTDILLSEGGEVKMSVSGTVVNGLAVSIPSVMSHTVGFGGDSYIRRNGSGTLKIGPERVIPICVLAERSKSIVDELRKMQSQKASSLCQPVELFMLGWAAPHGDLTAGEKDLLAALSDGPKCGELLARACGCPHPSLLPLDRLERSGAIIRSGLTPTDILHASGKLEKWDAEAARIAVEIYAADLDISPGELCKLALKEAQKLLTAELLAAGLQNGSKVISEIIQNGTSEFMRLSAELTQPVIGIGAPVGAYLPDCCKAFGMEPVIPEHSEVANAVGAIVGRIAVKAKAVISPTGPGVYTVHTPLDCTDFQSLTEAEEYAEKQVRAYLKERVDQDYAGFKFRCEVRKQRNSAKSSDGELLIESVVTGTAVCTSVKKGMVNG